MIKNVKKLAFIALYLMILSLLINIRLKAEELKYVLGNESLVNAGFDTGYSNKDSVSNEDDWHFGWRMGEFYVSGFTRKTEDKNGKLIFLKKVGDKVKLCYDLQQDINCLNGNEKLKVYQDDNGYDEELEFKETKFGKGMLFVLFTNYKNEEKMVVKYSDFLAACASQTADTEIQAYEEGDYKVILDYEITDGSGIGAKRWQNYRICFEFSIRNSNCMVYPFDVKTGSELLNGCLTENGFYLDLAKSRYLEVDIKREILNDGETGLIEDIRFNSATKDGDTYTDEGIYTITVHNIYTNRETIKKIYVGSNKILKAVVTTGLNYNEIVTHIKNGASINDNGTINLPSGSVIDVKKEEINPDDIENKPIFNDDEVNEANYTLYIICGLFAISIVIIFTCYYVLNSNKKRGKNEK